MIKPKNFLNAFKKNGMLFFVGVPDSILSGMISLLDSKKDDYIHRSAANEGGAIGLAIGYYISTSKIPVVYMQNSGLGNAINPLTSLVDKKVYGIPMVLVIGGRGILGYKDEPQHLKMGPITLEVLKVLGIKYKILTKENFQKKNKKAKDTSLKSNQPYALIVKPKLIETLPIKFTKDSKKLVKRKDFIEKIVHFHKDNNFIVGSTGNTAREIYYFLNKEKKNNNKIFHSIGGMGHANQIAAEYAKQRPNCRTIIADGDGAAIMHLGNFSTIRHLNLKNFIHIVFNNNVHESTGGQLVSSPDLDYKKLFKLFGYKKVFSITRPHQLSKILNKKTSGSIGILIKVNSGTIINLPRQDIKSLLSFKKLLKK